ASACAIRFDLSEPRGTPFPGLILANPAAVGVSCLVLSRAVVDLESFGTAMAIGCLAIALVAVLVIVPLSSFSFGEISEERGHPPPGIPLRPHPDPLPKSVGARLGFAIAAVV